MQRPKRPGRYHHDSILDETLRPGTPIPPEPRVLGSRIRRIYENNRYDSRESRRVIIRRRSPGETMGWVLPSRDYLECHSLEASLISTEQVFPPRPAPPPPPPASLEHHEPIAGPSTRVDEAGPSNHLKNKRHEDHDTRTVEIYNSENTSEMMIKLLSVLECPVCFDYVSPPILQCREGHLVCRGCRARLDLCPKCRQPFSDIRARALEQIAEVVRYPCYNAGCGVVLPLSERHDHEAICPYRQYQCTIEPCSWSGPRSTLSAHMSAQHPDNLISSNTHTINLDLSSHAGGKVFLMDCFNELFHCIMGVNRMQDIFVGFVMHLGPHERASDFLFEIKFKRDDPPYTQVAVSRTTLEESAIGTQITDANAIIVSFSTLQDLIQDNGCNSPPSLQVHISINQCSNHADPVSPTTGNMEKNVIVL